MSRILNNENLEPQLPGAQTQDISGLKIKIPSVDNPNIVLLNQEAKQLDATKAQATTKLQSKFENTAFGKSVGASVGAIKGVVQSVQNAVNTATSAVESVASNVINSSIGGAVGGVVGGAVVGAAAGAIVGALAKKSGVDNKIGKSAAIGAAAGAGTVLATKVIGGISSKLNPKGITPDGLNKQWSPDKVAPESIVGNKVDPITGAIKSINSTVNSTTNFAGTAAKTALSVSPLGTTIIAGAVAGGVIGGLVSKSGVGNKVGKIAAGAAVGAGAGAVLNVGLNSLQNRLSSIKENMSKPKVPSAAESSEQRTKTINIKKSVKDDIYRPWDVSGSLQNSIPTSTDKEETEFLNSDFDGNFTPEGMSTSTSFETGVNGERIKVTTNTTKVGNSITKISSREIVSGGDVKVRSIYD